jgi:hypothetical protein
MWIVFSVTHAFHRPSWCWDGSHRCQRAIDDVNIDFLSARDLWLQAGGFLRESRHAR